MGNGFQEVIYQRALAIEMRLAGIEFGREFEMPIFYRDQQIGTRRVDFLVEAVVSVELKAITKLEDVIFNSDNHSAEGKSFTDWRLPTKRELNLLYLQKSVVGGFATDCYWYSTEAVSI